MNAVSRLKAPKLVTDQDLRRLGSLLAIDTIGQAAVHAEALEEELEHAVVYPSNSIPPDVVTMNSRVVFTQAGSDHASEITIVYPWDSAPEEGRVSVLSPLGAALLGARAGTTIEWVSPTGRASGRRRRGGARPADARLCRCAAIDRRPAGGGATRRVRRAARRLGVPRRRRGRGRARASLAGLTQAPPAVSSRPCGALAGLPSSARSSR